MSKENDKETDRPVKAEEDKNEKTNDTSKASVNGDVQDKVKETVIDVQVTSKEVEKSQDNLKEKKEKSVEDDTKKIDAEAKTEKTEEDEESESDSDEELPPGLLERPIEILKDKRERKKTTRFTYDDAQSPSTEKKKFEIPNGRGIKLAQHPRVEWHLQKNKTEDLKIIHKLFFGTFGDAFTCKKNMRNFNGFPFEKDTPEYEKKEDYVGRFTLDNLKWALTVCDVENRKGKKEDLIDNFLEWCLCPKPSGKDVPSKRKRKEKPKSSKKKYKSSQNVSNSGMTSDDLSDDDDDDEDQEVTPKKSKQIKSNRKSQTPKSSAKKKQARKSTGSNKIAKIKISSPKKSEVVDSDDSDAPLQKKKKVSPPTDAQIRKAVEKILKGANLEVITMKAVCIKVYAQYPDFDLSERKAFIKETVKSIIS